jgi:hypothetical protein
VPIIALDLQMYKFLQQTFYSFVTKKSVVLIGMDILIGIM